MAHVSAGKSAHHRRRLLGGLALLAGLLAAGAAHAADESTYSVGVLGGVGGSFDVDPGNSYNNSSFQLNLAMTTEPRTQVGLRLGRINLDKEAAFGSLHSADLAYVTIGGEYRFKESYYDSGVYLGLGGYRLRGTDAAGRAQEQTSVGLAVGITGEIPINRWLGVLLELSGHYVDLDEAKIWGMGHAGLTVHF